MESRNIFLRPTVFFSKYDTHITHNATQWWGEARNVCWALFFLTPHLEMPVVFKLVVFWPIQHWLKWHHWSQLIRFSSASSGATKRLKLLFPDIHDVAMKQRNSLRWNLRFIQCCVQTNTNPSHLHGKIIVSPPSASSHCNTFHRVTHWTCTNRQSRLTHACIYLWAPRAVNMISSCAGSGLVCLKQLVQRNCEGRCRFIRVQGSFSFLSLPSQYRNHKDKLRDYKLYNVETSQMCVSGSRWVVKTASCSWQHPCVNVWMHVTLNCSLRPSLWIRTCHQTERQCKQGW